jgi:flagellin-like hook-associated protein FlgL
MTQLSTPAAAIAQERLRLFENMAPATQRLAKAGEDNLAKANRSFIIARYALGEMANMAKQSEAQYGGNAVEQLAMYWGIKGGASPLNQLMNFAKRFTREFVTEWSLKPIANDENRSMSLQHWLQLTHVQEAQDVDRLLHRIVSDGLTATELCEELRGGGVATNNQRSGGKKPKMPSSPIAGLQRTIALSKQLTNYSALVRDKLCVKIDDMPPDRIDATLNNALQKSIDELDAVIDNATRTRAELVDRQARVKRVIDKKPKSKK